MNTQTDKRPKWLRKLERESWQAELVISGAAIFGSLQLPGLLEMFQHYLLLNYDEYALFFWFFATIYWAIFVYGLIILFVFHFIIRALWIGLVGLNSIYPDGFKETNLSGKELQARLKEDYGDINGRINKLDRTASGMFGTGFAFMGVFFNLGFIFSVAILVATTLQSRGVPQFWAWTAGLIIPIIGFILSLVGMSFSLPKMRDKPFVKKYHYRLTKMISWLSYPINHNFTVTGMTLVSSNSAPEDQTAKKIIGSFLVFLLLMFGLGLIMGATDTMKPAFLDHVYHRMGDDEILHSDARYANHESDDLLYNPIMNAAYPLEGGPLWIWVPIPERELSLLKSTCSIAEPADTLSKKAYRKTNRQRNVDCAKQYIELSLDGNRINYPTPIREWRTSAGMDQYGFRIDLTELGIPAGRHQFKIVTLYALEDEPDDFRRTFIDFTVVR